MAYPEKISIRNLRRHDAPLPPPKNNDGAIEEKAATKAAAAAIGAPANVGNISRK
jgi:hypothetical protein